MSVKEEKINSIRNRYDEVLSFLGDPDVINDKDRYLSLTKELGDLEPKVEAINNYMNCLSEISEAEEMLGDSDMKDLHELAQEQLNSAKELLPEVDKALTMALMEKDPRDDRNVIMEIRGGAGGEEAALFAATLMKMYKGYAIAHGFTMEIVDINETDLGGIKEVVIEINGKGAYSRFKYESGVHRVQRVPVTESGGRVHTSTATVAVLPEVEATEVHINPEDLKIDTYRASGAGGQHVNRTDSAIRITHLPTGIVVQCQDERSQHKNRDKAMAWLQAKLWDMAETQAKSAEDAERRGQVGTGDRSERIRTYNYHQGRVTDHRIGLTLYRLDEILQGDLDEFIDALIIANSKDQGDE